MSKIRCSDCKNFVEKKCIFTGIELDPDELWRCSENKFQSKKQSQPQIRQFDSGATRDQDLDKFDFEGFLSPTVLNRFGQYMHKHRKQSDGNLRDSDNWQKGIPLDAYMKSAFRHFMDWWLEHRNHESREGVEDALCALMFNVMGYLHEILKEKSKETDRTKPVPGGY